MSGAFPDTAIDDPPDSADRAADAVDPPSASARRHRRAFMAIATGFALLVGTCGLAAVLVVESQRTAHALQAAWEVNDALNQAMADLLDAETSVRGYMLVPATVQLIPYDRALERFPRDLAQLRALVTNSARQAALVERIAALSQDKLAILARARARPEGAAGTTLTADGRNGTQVMDDIRGAAGELDGIIRQELGAATARAGRVTTVLLVALMTAVLCVIALALLLVRDTKRHLALLDRREATLRKLAASLEQRVARRTRALTEVNQRFDAALRASGVTVFAQDATLAYTWINKTEFGFAPAEMLGRTDTDLLGEAAQPLVKVKRAALESGEATRAEVRVSVRGTDHWFDVTALPEHGEAGEAVLIGGKVDITERKEQEARIRLLMRELTHRSKNLLSVIQAIMRQTAANAKSTDDFVTRFSARLHSLAGSHDLLVLDDWQGASIGELARSQLGHYSDLVGSQITLEGERLQLKPDAAQHVGMALHELATNAAKYGALSLPGGRVKVSWGIEADAAGARQCRLSWEEFDGPKVSPPTQRGFGRVVIERTVARAVGGEAAIEYPPSGVRWTLVFPATALVG